jgi:hypothetical protein
VSVLDAPAAGLAPDAALPQRDVLLDAEGMRDRLAALLGAAVDDVRRVRVKYRVGESLRVVYRLTTGGRERLVACRTFGPGLAAPAYARGLDGAPAQAGIALDAELETVFWTFPHDRRLRALAALDPASGVVAALLGRAPAAVQLAAYTPEKCAVAACLDADGAPIAYAKVYASAEQAARAHTVHAALYGATGPDHPRLGLPRPLAVAGDLVAIEPVPGALADALDGPRRVAAARRLGAAVATVHGLAAPAGLERFTRLEPARQRTAADVIARARPDLRGLTRRLAGALEAAAPADPGPAVVLHGDVHRKNAIDQGHRVAMIDLDQASLGPAAADLGSVLAGLRYHALLAGDPSLAAGERAAALAGYAAVRPLPAAAVLAWHVAAAGLSERALRTVNRLRPDGLARLGDVLADALGVLEGRP